MRIISFFTIWMVGVFAVQAQTVTADTYLDSARIEYYRNKDFRSILLLNQFLKDYPDHALADEVKLVVGTLYQTKKDFKKRYHASV